MKKTPVEVLRARLVALAAEDKALEKVPFGRSDVSAAIDQRAGYLRREWQNRVDLALGRLECGQSPAETLGLLLHPEKPGGIDALAALGLGGIDALANTLHSRLAEVVPEGPDGAARAARRAEIKVERHQIAREEEALIRASERDGTPILRRPDADPSIVLEVDGDTIVADDPPKSTTPADVLAAQQRNALYAANAVAAAEAMQPAESAYLKRRRP